MAMHDTLPIYKAAKQLLKLVLVLPKDMRKDLKHLIGGELLRESLKIMNLIRSTNKARDRAKGPYLEELLERLQYVEDLVTGCNEVAFISHKQYAEIVPVTQSLGKQASGLKNKYAPA